MALIDDVKLVLRISNSAYNGEINDLIATAKADLGLSGVLNNTLESDPLIKRAILIYCKANFGWENKDSYKLIESYHFLKNHISLSADYAFYAVTFTVKTSNNTAIQGAYVKFNNDTITTNAQGIAVFYTRTINNSIYDVWADGYVSDVDNYIDIYAATNINVVLSGV